MLLPSVILLFSTVVYGTPQSRDVVAGGLPDSTWYQHPGHEVHSLFRRDITTDGGSYPEVGSSTWTAAYPSDTPNTSKLPQPWVDALNAAVSAGSIPNIPPSTLNSKTGFTTYGGLDPNGPVVCSGTYQCRNPNDTWDAPAGVLGVSFDDGPTQFSPNLTNFLAENNINATHFMIGTNILQYPKEFLAIVDAGGDIAVHTWTHPYMTTLSNLQVVAEFGWTMQIIHDSTGGRVPRFWRPPYGDADNRVRAIASEVFGLRAIFWNQDTDDWAIVEGGQTMQGVNTSMHKWLTGPKSPGLIILEHELYAQTVQAFINAYPVMVQNGWNIQSVARIANGTGSAYWNADSSNGGPVISAPIIGAVKSVSLPASSSQTSLASSASSTPTHSSSSSPNAALSSVNSDMMLMLLSILIISTILGL